MEPILVLMLARALPIIKAGAMTQTHTQSRAWLMHKLTA